ncbi:hypothetical protein BKA70DRAFT_1530181 [Coprinopsis sp. MPI-PUGE-AT-0042]|nr:hypothetical protein BKA70DRAFT_1530181 [Coprinopsis sp. MPI-PUGE-AT-0042]
MSQPVFWPTKTFFYPVGNTPATHLTANLPLEQRADVLLLGCGDVRNILFTVYMESEHSQKELDFTCNDHEPAILTRNLLLYTLLIDSLETIDLNKLWNIYYHFYLDKPSLQLLYAQCRKLLELTTSIETWSSHKYGQHLRFCSDSTIEEIRHCCELYLEVESFDRIAKKTLDDAFAKGMSKTRARVNGGTYWRASGAAFPIAMYSGLCEDHLTAFWKTGLSAGTPTADCTYVNPTFAHSRAGRGFNPHYSTDPLAGFHLAPAFVGATDVSPVKTVEGLAAFGRAQFYVWCKAFQERCKPLRAGSLHIRFLLGDVLSAANALRRYSLNDTLETNVYASPWGGRKITFLASEYTADRASASTQFNAIDTSNVSDHVGLLNIVLTTLPLLRLSPDSRLSTHRLTRTFDRTAPSSLRDTGFDLPLISAITGLVLTRAHTNISTMSMCHEPAMCCIQYPSGSVKQFVNPLTWRFAPPNAPRIACGPKALAEALFMVYAKLYEDEDVQRKLKVPTGDLILYNRAAFAEVLCQTRRAILTDWDEMMDNLIWFITSDRTLSVGSSQFQDLSCHLFLRGLYTAEPLRQPLKKPTLSNSPPHPSSRWSSIVPPVVCVILVVPREHIRVLEEKEVSMHNLQCHTSGGQNASSWHNIHSSIRPIFGAIRRLPPSASSSSYKIGLVEDPLAWKGTSDLIVSFYMPSSVLTLNEPGSIQVALAFQNTFASIAALAFDLGPALQIYGTRLDDGEHVLVCASRPDNMDELTDARLLVGRPAGQLEGEEPGAGERLGFVEKGDGGSLPGSAALNFRQETKQACSIVLRADIGEPARKAALGTKENAVVRGEDGNYSITLKYGKYRQVFIFPFPVDIGTAKTRVARKSSYLEVEAQVLLGPESSKDGFVNPFEVQITQASPILSNMHYTSLNLLPCLAFKGQQLDWIKSINVLSMLSHREAVEVPATAVKHSIRGIKDSMTFLFEQFIQGNGKPFVMGLTSDNEGDPIPPTGINFNIVWFISGLRLDLHGSSLILDGCFHHWDQPTMKNNPQWIAAIQGLQDFRMMEFPEHTITMWKKMIPAIVERCRTWSHTPNCSYQAGATIPRSTGPRDDPICECGRGKDLGPFMENKAWKPLAPFVTRIAVGLVFPSNFEDIMLLKSTFRPSFTRLDPVGQPSPGPPKDIIGAGPPSRHEEDLKGKEKDSEEDKEELCWKCQGSGGSSGLKLLRCSRCKEARYCSDICQKADWKSHKLHCSVAK